MRLHRFVLPITPIHRALGPEIILCFFIFIFIPIVHLSFLKARSLCGEVSPESRELEMKMKKQRMSRPSAR